jgi:hypothetical protein
MMTGKITMLDVVRRDAQDLHKKISDSITNLQSTTDADLKVVSDKARELSEKLKTGAETQNEKVKGYMLSASERLKAEPRRRSKTMSQPGRSV